MRNTPKRALLSLATGAGKTFIAVNLLKRIADARRGGYGTDGIGRGGVRRGGSQTRPYVGTDVGTGGFRALFVCDRDELRTQGSKAFQNVFGSDAAEVFRKSDGTNNAKNARIHIATYQTLGIDADDGNASFLTEYYPENYFTHIIIDECHRSAWGKWSQVLTRNSQAAQIGLTATPRQLTTAITTKEAAEDAQITANNIAYFGEPVYEYSLAQAIEDGYLAACEIRRGRVNLDEPGLTVDEIMRHTPQNANTGLPLSREEVAAYYAKTDFESRLLLPDRVQAMCQDLFDYLCETGGPEQKTIIFCARDRHADDVATSLNNLYAHWCAANHKERLEPYAFKCTAASSGNDQLPDLRGASRSHFIATTVDLLTTGVDVPCVSNIVFFKYVKSPISFYQMVGRGTRIDLPTGKLMFRVYDYTDAAELFGAEFITKPPRSHSGPTPEEPPQPVPVIRVEGIEVHVTDAGQYIVTDVDGKARPVPVEEYRERLAARLVERVRTLEAFRTLWVDPPSRHELLDLLIGAGYSPNVIRMVDEKHDYDLYDVLAELGWGLNPRTRRDRTLAFRYKHEDWLNSLPSRAQATIRAIAEQFELGGTEGLENTYIFQTSAVKAAGGIAALQLVGKPADLLRETKVRMFAA